MGFYGLKRYVRRTGLWLAVGLLGLSAQAQSAERFTLAIVPAAGGLPIFVADEHKYFQEEGLDFQLLPINSGPGAASAVVSGSADMGYGGALPVIAARAQGIAFKYVLGGYADRAGVHTDTVMIASKRSGVKSVEDLRGKTVAVNNAGGVNDLQVRVKLREAGIPESEVKILAVPFPQMPAALELGNADVIATVAPFSSAVMLKGLGEVIAEGYVQAKDTDKSIPVAGFYATEEWLAKHPETLQKVTRAINKANQYIQQHPEEMKALLQKRLRLSAELAQAVRTPPYDTSIDVGGMQAIMDAAHLVGILEKPMKAQEVMLSESAAAQAAN